MSAAGIARIILYVKDVRKVAAFYECFFGMRNISDATDGLLELASPTGGCTLALHKAAVGQKSGAAMKISFGVPDVRAFISAVEQQGLKFGPVHAANGYEFSNAKDPAGNAIQISSRGMTSNQ